MQYNFFFVFCSDVNQKVIREWFVSTIVSRCTVGRLMIMHVQRWLPCHIPEKFNQTEKLVSLRTASVCVSFGGSVCVSLSRCGSLNERSWICNMLDAQNQTESHRWNCETMYDRPFEIHAPTIRFHYDFSIGAFAFKTKITREMTYFVWVEAVTNTNTYAYVEPHREPDGETQTERERDKRAMHSCAKHTERQI